MAEKAKGEALARGAFWFCLAVVGILLALGMWQAALAWIAPTLGAWILSRWSQFDSGGDEGDGVEPPPERDESA